MMNLISSLPMQSIPFEVPLGPALVASLAVVVALAVASELRAVLARAGRTPVTTLRPAHSH